MGETFYSFARSLSNYKSLFYSTAEENDNIYTQICAPFSAKYSINGDSLTSLCEKCIIYLNNAEANFHNLIENARSAVYLLCFLHDELSRKVSYRYNTLTVYNGLIDLYEEKYGFRTLEVYKKHIVVDIIEKVKNLYDLYDLFEKFTHSTGDCYNNCECAKKCVDLYKTHLVVCYKGINQDFCNELEKFRGIYNSYMEKISICDDAIRTLPSTKSIDLQIALIIPFVIILVMSFTLFILYKFTPFFSRLRSLTSRKKQVCKNIDQELHELQRNYEIPNGNSQNISYHLLYNSGENF
ncbi:PIR protein [Plasmodium ovale]|uniref:PIR protein n=1 Tax=Plasmodium ovale TaxID=36330 RepID=A0A1D3JCT6_PLAOA|nr:PIR protein [Plasmodium ovale]